MKINKIVGALTLIASAVASHGAQASTYNLGLLSSTPVIQFVQVTPGAINDRFDFSIGTLSDASAAATNHSLSFFQFSVLDIPNLSMSLFDSANAMINGPTVSGQSVANLNISAGNYHAQVTGNTTGMSGGAYSVSMVAYPAAVPVPAAVWLLGSGLIGLVGVARRKEA